MRPGEHEWPEEFRDEDKWLFLTKRQWVIIGIGLFLDFLLISITLSVGLKIFIPIIGILAGIILISCVVIAFLEIPANWYLFGSGMKIEKILLRLLLKRRKSQKKIYTKHYDNGFKEW